MTGTMQGQGIEYPVLVVAVESNAYSYCTFLILPHVKCVTHREPEVTVPLEGEAENLCGEAFWAVSPFLPGFSVRPVAQMQLPRM